MKRIIFLCLGVMLLASTASSQSLGEAARKNRVQKKPAAARVYTNDDLAATPMFNNGAATTAATSEKSAEDSEAAKAAAPEDREKLIAEWRGKLDEQKKAISLLEREVDVMQREYKQQVALFYADAGNQLRNQAAWAEQQRKYEGDITAKQQELASARQKLDDSKEEARKAGVPSSVYE